MDNRRVLYVLALSLSVAAGELAQAGQNRESRFPEDTGAAQPAKKLGRYAPVREKPWTVANRADFFGGNTWSPETYTSIAEPEADSNCREWKGKSCTVCGIDATLNISVKSKTKTPVLRCRDMKAGPARVVMMTHAEPMLPGLWEVEFGLGYQTSTRGECPHQFIASNSPPLKAAYEVGPITIEAEIPPDGTIQTLLCVGLSSARTGNEGKETGASLRVFKLRIVSE